MPQYDLTICGGGTAGVAAAYIGAKYGLKTLVIEKRIHLGGTMTSALVMPVMKSNTQNINCEFYNDFINELERFGGQITYCDGNKGWFNPELSKLALDCMLEKVNCDILYNTEIIDAFTEKRLVKSICVSSKMLSLYIDSLYFVDATGDGNFSQALKNNMLKNPKSRQPMTLRFQISNIDMKTFSDWLLKIDTDRNVTTACEVNGEIHLSTACTWDNNRHWALKSIFDKAVENGDLNPSDTAYFQIFSIPGMPGSISLNCPRIQLDKDIDPLDPFARSKALTLARKQIWHLYCFLKKYFPGFERSYISNIADMVGVRESRRVEGQKIYTKDDILSGKTYDSPVLHADYPIDIHSYNKDASTLQHTKVDYELPIECLKASGFDNLYLAGRIVSADFEAQAALRIQSSCFSMGEAAAKDIAKRLGKI